MNFSSLISTPESQEAARQHADLETWRHQCRALGATPEQIDAYEQSARAYAGTTPRPNSAVIALARRVALDVLLRGEPMPEDARHALDAAWARGWARLVGRAGGTE